VKTLIERWNGQKWSIVPSPNDPDFGGQLADVSCSSATFCFAVGNFQGYTIETLTVRWNGSSWKIVPSPSRRPSPQFETAGVNYLNSVSCVSPTSCMAVGSDTGYLYDFRETLTEHWNGTKWQIVRSPSPAKYSRFDAVSCATASKCFAVGGATPKKNPNAIGLRTLIARWNGQSWTRVTSTDPSAPQSELLGVSCPSATTCVAVGDSRAGNVDNPLVKRLTGGQWTIEASPKPADANAASLHGVTCTSATACVAVGESAAYSAPRTFAARYG